jgi:hypothetical protein
MICIAVISLFDKEITTPFKMYIATTRFTDITYSENLLYKERKNIKGVVYPCPMKISPKLLLDVPIIVIEMNNSKNEVCGVSLIRNKLVFNIRNVYSHTTFNRYVYVGKCHLNREMLMRINERLVIILDMLLFKGYSHQKRLQGISLLGDKLLTDERLEGMNIEDELKMIFNCTYNLGL